MALAGPPAEQTFGQKVSYSRQGSFSKLVSVKRNARGSNIELESNRLRFDFIAFPDIVSASIALTEGRTCSSSWLCEKTLGDRREGSR